MFYYHRFSFPWYCSSWANNKPHHSNVKFRIAALSIWCVMFLVRRFVENLLNVALVLFPDCLNFYLQCPWPKRLLVWQSISCSTFPEFLFLDFIF
jgi:hypothetical protein